MLKHAFSGNGHVHVAVDLACTQADAGHEVTLASGSGPYGELLRAHGVRVVELPEPGNLIDAGRSGWALLRLSRRVRPDIIHAHMMSSAVLSYPIAKAAGAVLVTTVHNSFDSHSSLMRLGRVVVAVSDAERQRLLKRGFPAAKVRTVLNGPIGSPREELADHVDVGPLATPCVVSLSGLHARKAVDDIITAFGHALPSASNWHLNIIGWGPDQRRLEQLVETLGLSGSVHFVGFTSTPWRQLEQADVFVSASVDEPFGLSVAEARAAGCAVVATAVGGVPEVVEHGRAGRLVPAKDPQALGDALRELMVDRDLLTRWQARAGVNVEYFSVRRMAEDYEAVYRSVLNDEAATLGRPP